MEADAINIQHLIAAALKAGEEILKVYETDFQVAHKSDDSPLTLADQKSHDTIVHALTKHYPEIPILSEEGQDIAYAERQQWHTFWLVDPLDGTKEFVKRNGEFTVNIALVVNAEPVIGVIYAPVLDTLYIGKKHWGTYKIEDSHEVLNSDIKIEELGIRLPSSKTETYTVVASRSHMSEATAAFIAEAKTKYGEVITLSAGSSLKLCLVAEGKANAYPRYAPTMEWDTGAGQAIVEAAGGTVTVADSKAVLTYNKENLRNPWFLVERD
ncbi:3'(2'), 5'-bisphosphate nucleotidase [Pullulanibacillus pueri]|uniref:3'(2'),5'-bisphosphate nucleotidase CysQ n=1 Tax=Pullulanibacillus pueri TaxID=1437324 RepID=A0A8J2ZTP9_9BACL|nr:3'(2'),5'-bisphosphate nucleotidase CysQ [Pullulanibacillus pueri]MBM7683611.1 3'(2'), 5'-bisphosphate nucleotidase [Pullulanibacillus pueri]GGH76544.1 3'(2'),5'-bisphosphate nucleotidase CysQ [Pullulanibacillus pueri]